MNGKGKLLVKGHLAGRFEPRLWLQDQLYSSTHPRLLTKSQP